MELTRRGFLKGMLALGAAPAIIVTPGLLMPVRQLWTPSRTIIGFDPSSAYDYSAWVKVHYDEFTGVMNVVDWGPKNREFKVTGASIAWGPANE